MADTNTVPTWVAIVSTLVGGGLVGIFNFITNWINKKSEDRKHLQTLMFNAGIENWKQDHAFADTLIKTGQNTKISIMPLDSYIIHMIQLFQLLTTEKLTKENATEKLKEVYEITSTVNKFLKDRDDNK